MEKIEALETENLQLKEAVSVGNARLRIDKRTIHIELEYPRLKHKPNAIEIGLTDVRAADGIRVIYDFKRDGWVILQASIFEWEGDAEKACDRGWKEAAFIQAWQFDEKGER